MHYIGINCTEKPRNLYRYTIIISQKGFPTVAYHTTQKQVGPKTP